MNSIIIIFTEKVFILGQTPENTRVTGEPTKCTGKEPSLGLTEENMLVSMLMTRRRDMANLFGLMEDATGVNGSQANNMVKEHTLPALDKKNTVNGEMERE